MEFTLGRDRHHPILELAPSLNFFDPGVFVLVNRSGPILRTGRGVIVVDAGENIEIASEQGHPVNPLTISRVCIGSLRTPENIR